MRSSGDERMLRESSLEEEGVPDMEGDPEGMVLADADIEDIVPPRDLPGPSIDYGVTAAEQQIDEPLADRVRREEPDFWEQALAEDDRITPGRLVQPDEGAIDVDEAAEEVGFGTGDIYGMSAEEEAIRVTDEDSQGELGLGGGMPGYLQDD
jgi:hypothetical protein